MLLASEFLKYKANLRVPHHIRNLFMFLLVLTGVAVTSGCTLNKPYAKNPYNLYVKLPDDSVTASSGARTSKAIDLALSASSRPIPGAIPHGAGVGIAAAAFLLGSEGTNKPFNGNFLLGSMPITMANSEQEAKIKLGSIIEKAITLALQPEYQVKIEEYDDTYAFGPTLRPRWLRVDGPLCENWACQIIAPIPTANALQWEGDVHVKNGGWQYKHPVEQSIAFLKIVNEYDKDGLFNNRRHHVEGYELADFDYLNFLTRVSANLPEWLSIVWTPIGKSPYEIRQGSTLPLNQTTSSFFH
ncbi:MAG: hypothetical protein KGZ88_11465 [Methylomicrobium sp.]|nr:hypothetical protein [Methylomicrobium sp.]